jgi:hypothetical protein
MKNLSTLHFFYLAFFSFSFFTLSQAQLISDDNFSSEIITSNNFTLSNSDCNSIITKSKTSIRSDRLTLVRRGDYSYSIRFATQDGNILAFLTSENGVELKKRDELILMTTDRSRIQFTFCLSQSLSNPTNKAINEQWFEMDHEDLVWLVSNSIKSIYIKDNGANRMIKFNVDVKRQKALKKLAFCFLKEIQD